MKVLITTDLYLPAVNGVVTSIYNLKEQLELNGHEVRILTVSYKRKSFKEGNIYYIKSIPLKVYPNVRTPISYYNNYIKELIAWNPDVIHSQCEFFSYEYARIISHRTGCPVVHTYHTLYEQYTKYVKINGKLGNHVVALLSRERLKGIEALIVPTLKVKKAVKGYGIKKRTYVIPTGIDLEKFKKAVPESEISDRKKQFGIPDNNYVLVSVGRLGYEKNTNELIDNFASLRKVMQNVTFVIVGDGPAREDLTKQVEKLNLKEHVIFTGMINSDHIQEYYLMGDIFISASTSETQGLTYAEAAANGLPLVCRCDDSLKDVIIQGENGYCYTDTDEFVEYIGNILNNEILRKSAHDLSIEISKKFSKEQFGLSVIKVYKHVICLNKLKRGDNYSEIKEKVDTMCY